MDSFSKGDLVRWVTGHNTFAAHPDRLEGVDPIYKYGIVMQVSDKDPNAIIVHSYDAVNDYRLIILDGADEEIEILSSGA